MEGNEGMQHGGQRAWEHGGQRAAWEVTRGCSTAGNEQPGR